MKQKKWTSAYLKMWLSFSILVTATMLVMLFACYSLFDRSYIREVQEKQIGAIRQAQNILDHQLIGSTRTIAADLSTSIVYTRYLRQPLVQPEQMNVSVYQVFHEVCAGVHNRNSDLLEQVCVYYPGLGICISNVSGYKILNQSSSAIYREFANSVTESSSESHLIWQAVDSSRYSAVTAGSLTVSLSPLINGIGRDSVRLILCINPYFMESLLRSLTVENQDIYLTDAAGGIIYGTGAAMDETLFSSLISSGTKDPVTAADTQTVFARCALGDSGLNLIISTPIDSWQGSIRAIRWTFCLIGAGIMLASLALVFRISKRLYAPVRILTELVRTLPVISPRQAKNEYELIRKGLMELSNLLSDNQRVLHVNQSLLKNQSLTDLALGHNLRTAIDTLSLLKIHFPREHFSMMAVEYCENDAAGLSPSVRQVLLVALIDVVEKRFERRAEKVFGFMPNSSTACFILNYDDRTELNLPELRQMITAYWDCYHIRCYLAETRDELSRIDFLRQGYDSIRQLLSGRVFDLRPLAVHDTPVTGQNTLPVQAALARLDTLSVEEDSREIIRVLEEITVHIAQLHPEIAGLYLSRCVASLQRLMLLQRPDKALPPFLRDTDSCLWRIDELPRLLEKEWSSPPSDHSLSDDSRLIQAVNQYIRDHLSEDISLEGISEAFHFNPKYFSRKFKKITGSSLIAHITFQRMETAAEMLQKTELTMDAIAEKTGYKSTQYFIRKFKEMYHATPGEYRRAMDAEGAYIRKE